MMIVKTPGINGLGKTVGVRDAGNTIISSLPNKKELRLEEIHVDNSNLEEQEDLIRKNALKLFEEEDKTIFLGGDHSISYPIIDSLKNIKGNNFKLVIFDAHADCMPPMKEPTHEEWLRALIENGFPGKNIMLIGLNKTEDVERKYLKEKGVNLTENLEEIKDFINNQEIYISFDIDVFKEAKATGYPEGKLTKEQTLKLLDTILENSKLIGCDIVEVDITHKDVKETIKLATTVLEKFISVPKAQ